MKKIPLRNKKGEVVAHSLVDDDDFEVLGGLSWNRMANGYVKTDTRINGKRKSYFLHRIINNTPEGMDTDHINGDKLDNRKSNLRSVTRSENMFNQRSALPCSKTGLMGVSPVGNRFQARIQAHKRQSYLGLYKTPEEAHTAYMRAKAVRDSFIGEPSRKGEE